MWTEEMTQVIQDQFVAVAVSGHVAMGRKDAEGDFLRATGIQLAGAGGNLECLTASGIRLGSFYAAGGTEHNVRDLRNILEKWRSLPASEREPGAIKIDTTGPTAANVLAIAPPVNALILRTYHRLLSRAEDGQVRKAKRSDYPALTEPETWVTHFGERWEAQPDFMWIKESEWRAIVRPDSKPGDTYPLLDAVADRMTRAHLILGMAYGECGVCDKREVRSRSLTLTVTDVSPDQVQLRLNGAAALGADFETAEKEDRKGNREGRSVQGFEPKVLGYLTWDRHANSFTHFDVIALGDAYGTPSGDHYFNYRPGKYPVGISMELVRGNAPADRIPPRASVVYDTPNPAYFATGK